MCGRCLWCSGLWTWSLFQSSMALQHCAIPQTPPAEAEAAFFVRVSSILLCLWSIWHVATEHIHPHVNTHISRAWSCHAASDGAISRTGMLRVTNQHANSPFRWKLGYCVQSAVKLPCRHTAGRCVSCVPPAEPSYLLSQPAVWTGQELPRQPCRACVTLSECRSADGPGAMRMGPCSWLQLWCSAAAGLRCCCDACRNRCVAAPWCVS